MEFDELKGKWSEMKAPDSVSADNAESLIGRIKNVNKGIIRTNIISTITLSATVVFLGLIWSWYPDRSIFFYGSILGIQILIVITMILYWRRVLFWKTPDLSLSNVEFIEITLSRLRRSSFIRKKFMPVYHFVLFISLMLYTYDLTREASLEWQIGLFVGNILFMGIVVLVSFRIQSKKHKEGIEKLIEEMEKVHSGLIE